MPLSFVEQIEYFLTPLTSIGDTPNDSEEVKLQHRFLIYMGVLMSFGGLIWGSMTAYFNLFLPSIIPYGYAVLTAINLFVFYKSKNFGFVRFFQVMISLLLPFAFQWSLGGFVPSGAVMLWAMLALVGAFTFQTIELNIRWLAAYLVLTILSGLVNHRVAIYSIETSPVVTTLFFVINIFVVSGVVFGLSFYLSAKQRTFLSEIKVLSTAIEQTTDSVMITNLQGDIEYVNHALEQVTGYCKEELVGKTPNILKSGYHSERFYDNLWKTILAGRIFQAEFVNKRKNGDLYYEEKTIIALKNKEGEITHFVSTGRDITERKEAEQERLRLRVIQQELSIAHDMQESLLPPSHPDWDDIDVVCFSTPAKDVGGDFYRYHKFASVDDANRPEKSLQPNHPEICDRYAFALGDVSGKGVSAALLMATSLSQLDASLLLNLSPSERLAHLDKTILPYTQPRRQNCAMSYMELCAITEPTSPVSHMLTAVNAGCIPPYIRRADGSVEHPEIGGFALGQGLGAEFGYQQLQLALSNGDMVILVSDGVVEANNSAGEMFGFERLEQTIRAFSPPNHDDAVDDLSVTSYEITEFMLEYLKTIVLDFIGDAEPHDDITIVIVQV